MIKPYFHQLRRMCACWWLGHMPSRQIAITGSQGKTAVSQALAIILSKYTHTVVTDINLDTTYNVPITALRVKPWTRYSIFELGIDRLGEMKQHMQIVHPHVGVLLAVGKVHTDAQHMQSYQNVLREKRILIDSIRPGGTAILNISDLQVASIVPTVKAQVVTFGACSDKPMIGYDNVRVTKEGTTCTIYDSIRDVQITVRSRLYGTFYAQTFACLYAIIHTVYPVILPHFAKDIASLSPLVGRMSMRPGPRSTTILDDSLRANPDSTRAGIETFAAIPHTGRKIVVMADMRELADPETEHRTIGTICKKHHFDTIFCIGTYQKYTAQTIGEKAKWFPTIESARRPIASYIEKGDFIYLKGSKYSYVGSIFADQE